MPSASVSATNMNNLVRDTYQANSLLRSHQQPIASSQTSLQKLPASSPQILYPIGSNPQSQPSHNMQFPPPPLMNPMGVPVQATNVPKNDATINPYNPIVAPHLMNINHTTLMAPSNGLSNQHTQSTILMSPTLTNKEPQTSNLSTYYAKHQHQYQQLIQHQPQYSNTQQQQHQHQQQQQQPQHQQQLQHQQQQHQHQLTPGLSMGSLMQQQQQQQQQQVPLTTLMIPASAASQIQSASIQIQQAAMQAMATNPGQPQILVFMIPYMYNQPPTIPPTPEQPSLNSTLVRQSQSSTLNRPPPQQQQNISAPANSRAVSSLSNAKQDSEKFYIKANFSYHPNSNKMELMLTFQKGDILHVLDTLQNNDYGQQYWLATRLTPSGESEKGLIPDKNKADEIALEAGQGGGTLDASSSGVLSASVGRVNFLKRRAAQRSKSLCKDNWDNVVFDIGSCKLPAYERVVYKHPGFCRPVVVFGPLADVAREKLLKDYPEKYSYPTGFHQSQDHPKVIRLKGILEVIDQGKHALLDITPSAVEKLNYVNLAPIVIFMKTDSKSIIKEFRSRAVKSLDPNAKDEDTLRRDGKSSRKLLEQSMKLEKMWYHVFTATLNLSTMGSEMWYRKLRETIENQQSANVWMNEKKSDKKVANTSHVGDMMLSVSDGQSSSHLEPSSSLHERFNESLNITSKSTIDLLPEGTYGNRSQQRNAYAHSLAQKLARASSEPKLNGLMSENEDDDEDDDDDEEIIKKPFPSEFENSSSISSSNGATSYGQGSMTGTSMSFQNYPPQTKSDLGLNKGQDSIYSRNPVVNSTYSNGNGSNRDYHALPPMMNPDENGYHNQSMSNVNNNVIDLSRNHETRGSAFQVYSDMNQNNYHYYNLNKI